MRRPFIPKRNRHTLRELRRIERRSDLLRYYILREDGTLRPASTLHWGLWHEASKSQLFSTELFEGKVRVSTVFLGFDHNLIGRILSRQFKRKHTPLFFETIVFGLKSLPRLRYSTMDDALLGHMELTEWVKQTCPELGDGEDE